MVKLVSVLSRNAALRNSLAPGLVAVFVGGTSGISLSTAQALARHCQSPKIYLLGRNKTAAETAIASIRTINPSASAIFLQADISLLENVDAVCEQITNAEKELNLLFMTPGVLTLKGRDETSEGLDKKMVLHYYARMRFLTNLMPLLSFAVEEGGLSRVVSVLDPHVSIRLFGSGKLDYEDLSLKRTFSLNKCGKHASLMGNFFLEGMADGHKRTGFIHSYPSGVATGVMRELPFSAFLTPLLTVLLRPFMVPLEESGERHLFAATSRIFSARDEKDVEGQVVGSDGVKGSGCYWINWDGEALAESKKLVKTRQEGAVDKVMAHTEEVFSRVCVEARTYL